MAINKNFPNYSKAIIPIKRITFHVGENRAAIRRDAAWDRGAAYRAKKRRIADAHTFQVQEKCRAIARRNGHPEPVFA